MEIVVNRAILNRPLRFGDVSQLQSFLDREQEVWRWTDDADIWHHAIFGIENFRGNWQQPLKDLAANAADDPTVEEELKSRLNQRYQGKNEWCSEDQEVWQVYELAKDSPEAAAIAMAVLTGRDYKLEPGWLESKHAVRRGRAIGISILAGVDAQTLDGARSAIEATRAGMTEDAGKLRGLLSTVKTDARTLLGDIRQEATSQSDQIAESSKTSEEGRQQSYDDLKRRLAATDDFFSKQMETQGAVRYWGARAAKHIGTANQARKCLLWFTAGAVGVLLLVYSIAAWYLPSQLSPSEPIPLTALFKASAFGILITTVAFWIGRVILRIYLSERHLATDAEERRTMVMTYLGLMRRQKLSDDDKKLIFPAIFRSGADGIVKDDGSPDTAFAALVASIMKK